MTVKTWHEKEGVVSSPSSHPLSPALAYHQFPVPGKFATLPTKKLSCATDLALAYSPGVAEACHRLAQYPEEASLYTMRQHLVAVISNGTAVLGLGNIGALASKPVMEGKAVLFQLFSGLNAIDLEISEQDPEKLIEIIASLAPSFGAINLEDIKAPECFRIEEALKERLNIPVFHDDQHGTAIIVAAAMINALELVGKKLENSRCVVSGAGAGALACVGLLVELGMPKHHITLCDTKGVIHTDREDLSTYKREYARATTHRSLGDALEGADILLGLSGPGSVTSEMVARMAHRPLIFALANPIPEIWPHEVQGVRSDALVGTGRSDLPNQVNNVLCFPYIFRGAMDAGSKGITLPMKKACVGALSQLAKEGFVDLTGSYGGEIQDFGPNYFIPKPFDLRLAVELPLAVARVAMESGEVPTFDLDHYRSCLVHRFYRDFLVFKGLLARKTDDHRPIPSLGYIIETLDESIPNAVRAAARVLKVHGLAQPYFIGNRAAILAQLRGDSVLAHVPVYSSAEYFSRKKSSRIPEGLSQDTWEEEQKRREVTKEAVGNTSLGARHDSGDHTMVPYALGGHIRVLSSHGLSPESSSVQGFFYEDRLHCFAQEAPSSWMISMLESCGGMVKMGSQNSSQHAGDPTPWVAHEQADHRPSDTSLPSPQRQSSSIPEGWKPSPLDEGPHFGGLAFKKPLEILWHVGTAPSFLGTPCFGPLSLYPEAPCIGAEEDVRWGIERSAWALRMGEISV